MLYSPFAWTHNYIYVVACRHLQLIVSASSRATYCIPYSASFPCSFVRSPVSWCLQLNRRCAYGVCCDVLCERTYLIFHTVLVSFRCWTARNVHYTAVPATQWTACLSTCSVTSSYSITFLRRPNAEHLAGHPTSSWVSAALIGLSDARLRQINADSFASIERGPRARAVPVPRRGSSRHRLPVAEEVGVAATHEVAMAQAAAAPLEVTH